MKKIYTMSLAMMLAALPAMAQPSMKLHAPAVTPATPMTSLRSAAYQAPAQSARKAAKKADAPAGMKVGYCSTPYSAYGLGCGETGVGIMFPADFLKDFVGNDITALNVSAPYSKKLSSQSNQVNALTKAKIMICTEANGAPVSQNEVTLGTQAFVENELSFTTPYTIKEGEDLYLYIEYEGASTDGDSTTDFIIVADGVATSNPNAGWLYSKFGSLTSSGQVQLQNDMEWKGMADIIGAGSFNVTATITGDNLPQDVASPYAYGMANNIKPGTPFNFTLGVVNQGMAALQGIDMVMKIGDQEPQTAANCPVYDAQGQQKPVNYGEMALIPAQFTCNTEGASIPFEVSISKVNGVENSRASETLKGYILCLENGYPAVAVIEEFTSTSCPACPIGIAGLEEMDKKYGDNERYIPIAVHYSQGAADPMDVCKNQSYCYYDFVMDYADAQGGVSAPAAFLNRDFSNQIYPMPDELDYYISSELEGQALAQIDATLALTDSESKVTLNTTVNAAIDTEGNYGISYTILEDDLGPYRQQNGLHGSTTPYYGWESKPASVSMKYNDIVRAGSQYRPLEDSKVSGLKKGEAYTYSTTVDLSAIKDLTKYSVVAMLIDTANGHIMSAKKVASLNSGLSDVAIAGEKVATGFRGGINMLSTGNIYTMDGRQVAASANGIVNLPAGLYIVATPQGNAKIMVR